MSPTGDSRSEKNWLVKSSTRILGPYSVDEVAQLLLRKHISIIDEVRQPDGRWRYIREHRIFDEVVHALRTEQENSAEHTQTQTQTLTATAATGTSITRTDLIHGEEMTVTPTPPPPPAPPPPVGRLQRQDGEVVKDITPVRETSLPQSMARASGTGYGTLRDQRIQHRFSQTQNIVKGAIVALGILLLVAVGITQLTRNMRRDQSYEALIEQTKRYRSQFLFEKALLSYRKASQIRVPDAETQSQMALVLIVLDRQYVGGRRILENDLVVDDNNRSRKVEALLGIAMSYTLEGSYREAEENLQKIIGIEPANLYARINMGMIAIRKGQWREAADIFQQVTQREPLYPLKPLVLLARGMVALETGVPLDDPKIKALLLDIRSAIRGNHFVRHELMLMRAALTPHTDPDFMLALQEFLSETTRQSVLFVRDLRLDWRIADWDILDKYCRRMMERAGGGALPKASYAVCLSEAGRDGEAQRALNEAMVQSPNNPLILFAHANLMFRGGLRNEATAILRMNELRDLPHKDLLMGRICLEQGDLDCAARSFNAILSRDGRSIQARAGLAAVMLQQERMQDAHTLIRDGLNDEPYYLPLIELRDKRESQR